MPVKSEAGIRATAVHKSQSHNTASQTAQLHRHIRHLPQQQQSKDPKSSQKKPPQIYWLVWLCKCLHLLFSWLVPTHPGCCIWNKSVVEWGTQSTVKEKRVHFPKGHQAENIHPQLLACSITFLFLSHDPVQVAELARQQCTEITICYTVSKMGKKRPHENCAANVKLTLSVWDWLS